ncbi:hypothetical protein [Alkalihalobacillus sp. TS-13]|uniref:TolB family protein n=1 Tax=Alkalihalobacillus sp. TS-13 TaxID=2842455 RepID=UPI002892B902|nr:hypothetical protein [Alkalihalobacillus sp. TS-13]
MKFPMPDVEQFFQTLGIKDFVISPTEEQLIISTNINGHYNLWGMDLPNKYPYPLTFQNQLTHGLHYSKTGDFILVGFDRDGDENIQLYALQPCGGNLIPIRKAEGEKHYFSHLTNDGKRLYYTSSVGNATYLNAYCYNLDTQEEELIVEGTDGGIEIMAVSDDEESIIYSKHFSNSNTRAFIRRNEQDISLTPPSEEEHMITEVVFTSDDTVYFTTNYGSDFSYLAKYNLITNEYSKVLELEKEDLTTLKFDKFKNQLYLISTSGVEDRLFVYYLMKEQTSQKACCSRICRP